MLFHKKFKSLIFRGVVWNVEKAKYLCCSPPKHWRFCLTRIALLTINYSLHDVIKPFASSCIKTIPRRPLILRLSLLQLLSNSCQINHGGLSQSKWIFNFKFMRTKLYSGSTEYAKNSTKWTQEKEWYRLRVSIVINKPDKCHYAKIHMPYTNNFPCETTTKTIQN